MSESNVKSNPCTHTRVFPTCYILFEKHIVAFGLSIYSTVSLIEYKMEVIGYVLQLWVC